MATSGSSIGRGATSGDVSREVNSDAARLLLISRMATTGNNHKLRMEIVMSETDKTQDDEKIDTVARAEATAPKPFSTVGATEDETADRDREVAPGFTDMEPGAGPDYGPT